VTFVTLRLHFKNNKPIALCGGGLLDKAPFFFYY